MREIVISINGTMHPGRIYNPTPDRTADGPVVYWMSRDQRAHDNWALHHAAAMAGETRGGLAVVFTLAPSFRQATWRQYAFMLDGLRETEEQLNSLGIPFYLLTGDPVSELDRFCRDHQVGTLVTDFDPLRIKRRWKNTFIEKNPVRVLEVDAHNIVPCRKASDKPEFAAYTLRPKIHRLLEPYLDEFPGLPGSIHMGPFARQQTDWDRGVSGLEVDRKVKLVDWIKPGSRAALKTLEAFLQERLDRYAGDRNDPNRNGQSNLSPYLHFGQLSAQRVALEVLKNHPRNEHVDAFLEELIVRRELSDNFCLYNPHYDSPEGFHNWAQKTIEAHRKDEREYIYGRDVLEKAETHDPLWNAAQTEMVRYGKMHGYMRMYWAKKILEWTPDVGTAMKEAIYLNDKYELDGRDPNGYAGIAWSIGGVHDRAWTERPVFGKIRYMNARGARRKFDVDAYIAGMQDREPGGE